MDENNFGSPTPMEEVSEVSTNDTPIENTTQETENQQQEQKQSFKVKHLHEEKEISFDEAPTYIQKGMDYDRIKTKFEESKPVLSFVENLAKQNGMTVPEYLQAVEEYEKQQQIEALAQQRSLDPELAEELYLSRQERQQREIERQQQAQQQQEQKEYVDFINQFPEIKPESIPSEVWTLKAQHGLSITDAYIRHEYNAMKAKLKAQEVNEKNAESATGSLTGNGSAENDFISYDMFDKNRSDSSWVQKNYEKIVKSRAKW